MGKIYTFTEIQEKHIPDRTDFRIAKSIVLEEMEHFVEQGIVAGAKVFGSVGKETPSVRSDFDLVVILNEDTLRTRSLLKDRFDNITGVTNVIIEPILISHEFAEKGFHSIDSEFLKHIRSISEEGNTVGQNPGEVIIAYPLAQSEVHVQYLSQKLRRFNEGYFTNNEADKRRVLQRALEAPVNIGRRTLSTLASNDAMSALADDSKQAVTESFSAAFSGSEVGEGFSILLSYDARYNRLLDAAIEGKLSRNVYEVELTELIKESIPRAIKWTTDIATMYHAFLEGTTRGFEGNTPHNPEHFY
jgi:predicted nucleotidyltransferase